MPMKILVLESSGNKNGSSNYGPYEGMDLNDPAPEVLEFFRDFVNHLALPDEKQLAFLHRIDNVLFCHGGLADDFVRQYVPAKYYNDIDAVIETINSFGAGELWQDASPLWYRPQHYGGRMYKPRKLLRVVGHTPVEAITKKGNLISCDVFYAYRDGRPIGTQEFLVLNTGNWNYQGIR